MDITKEQSRNNSKTRDAWQRFDSHRTRIADLICRSAGKLSNGPGIENDRPSLAIFGAGNGNDLAVERLLETFGRIHMFDLDQDALDHLKDRHCQSRLAKEVIHVEPAIDLTGIVTELQRYPQNATRPQAEMFADKARAVPNIITDRQFDMVVSTCMLTQLFDGVLQAVGAAHPHTHFLMFALREGHLNLMCRAIRPGGVGLLVTDIVSSDTLPELKNAKEESVLAIARQAIKQRNFFTGTLPWAIKDLLSTMLLESADQPWEVHSPWKWQIGTNRCYLVTAIEFAKTL